MARNSWLDSSRIITWLLLLFILAVLANIYTLVKDREQVYKGLEDTVVARVLGTVKDGEHGDTPIKGVDYNDGEKGDKGEPGQVGVQGADGVQGLKGEPGDDGAKGDTGEPGYTPVKDVDYTDGEQGEPGFTGENGEDGQDGKTPTLRCNTNKNVWQVQYEPEGIWQAVKDQNGNNAKCVPGLL